MHDRAVVGLELGLGLGLRSPLPPGLRRPRSSPCLSALGSHTKRPDAVMVSIQESLPGRASPRGKGTMPAAATQRQGREMRWLSAVLAAVTLLAGAGLLQQRNAMHGADTLLLGRAAAPSSAALRTTQLYTSPHAEVAPFSRVWNPDTNNVYEDPDDWPSPPRGGSGITKDELCGNNGDECPELPSFNGEDYFDDKP
ncbi:MAG: hypothetical protein ACPIOQ_34405, partial [Promethearchaeia archaeon]